MCSGPRFDDAGSLQFDLKFIHPVEEPEASTEKYGHYSDRQHTQPYAKILSMEPRNAQGELSRLSRGQHRQYDILQRTRAV
jgi:hypothetical protein